MNLHDCLTRNVLAPLPELEGMFASILVPDDVKHRLINHAVLALRLRAQLPFETTALHGLILLYGPPGTGKTTLARGVANLIAPVVGGRTRLIEVDPHGLMSAEHGQSQQRVAELLGRIIPDAAGDGLPTIVLLDEVESMAVARSEASLAANPVDVHRATDAVLTALDQITAAHPHILWIATSNFTQALDAAFQSRADVAIEVPLPGREGVEAIVRDTLRRYGAGFPGLLPLADHPRLTDVAAVVPELDGRRTRKLVPAALARKRETAVDPSLLTIEDLLAAARSYAVGGEG